MKYNINRTGAWVVAGIFLTLVSCKKDFESINTPPEGATAAPTEQVYNAIISSLPVTGGEYSVWNSWIYPITQQAIVTSGAYPYDNAKDAVWTDFYTALGDYRLLQSRISATTDSTTMNNLSGMLRTIMAYKTFKTTNYFGDMPYFKAGYAPLDGASGYKAAFDKQSDIYAALLTDLQWAVNNFSTSSNQYSLGSYETFFQNDISMWTKFANSLRLYIALTMYDKNNALATTHITEALTKPLLEDGDDVGLWPSKISGLQFQWRQWSFSANCYLRMGTTMWGLMSSSNATSGADIFDIRANIFYEPNNGGLWNPYPQNPPTGTATEGGTPYSTSRFTDWSDKGSTNLYSPVNLYFEQDLTYVPELMLTSAQVHFMKAEIYNRGIGASANSATAQTEYNEGIAASLNLWKGIAYGSSVWTVAKPSSATATSGEISAVTNSTVNAYDLTDATHALTQIYAQWWIDLYRQPGDAWTLQRRTGRKTPMSTDNTTYYTSTYGGYQRFVYPDKEVSYNYDNFNTATGGSNLNTTKIWIAQ